MAKKKREEKTGREREQVHARVTETVFRNNYPQLSQWRKSHERFGGSQNRIDDYAFSPAVASYVIRSEANIA